MREIWGEGGCRTSQPRTKLQALTPHLQAQTGGFVLPLKKEPGANRRRGWRTLGEAEHRHLLLLGLGIRLLLLILRHMLYPTVASAPLVSVSAPCAAR